MFKIAIYLFTFHNVSINSNEHDDWNEIFDYLHSIMYLLIPSFAFQDTTLYPHLHSIMYLLIRYTARNPTRTGRKFTFHNVSINSI